MDLNRYLPSLGSERGIDGELQTLAYFILDGNGGWENVVGVDFLRERNTAIFEFVRGFDVSENLN